MAIEGKKVYAVYLDPQNVEYLRSQWGGESFMGQGLSGLVDAYIRVLVTVLKKGKAVDKKGRINWVYLVRDLMAIK